MNTKKQKIKIDGIRIYCSHSAVVDIKDLKPNPENPNVHPVEQIKILAEMIRGNGWRNPITVSNRSGLIVKGHGRYLAAKQAGLKKAPVDYQDYKTDADEYADLVGDNKISEFSIIDEDAAKALIESLDMNIGSELNLNLFGYTDDEITDLFPELVADDEDLRSDIVPDMPEEAKTNLGDLYKLGDHRLLCGDATNRKDVARLMAGKKADMVFTDPPYGVGIGSKNRDLQSIQESGRITTDLHNDNLSVSEIADIVWKPAFINVFENLKSGGVYYITAPQGGDQMMMMMMMTAAKIPCRHELIWVKNQSTFSMGRLDYDYKHEPILYGWKGSHKHVGNGLFTKSIWKFDRERSCSLHPTMKPVALIENALLNSSIVENFVVDVFMGSGSTLIACEKTNRKCYGMEIDPLYCDVIVKRWEDYTGKKAKLISK